MISKSNLSIAQCRANITALLNYYNLAPFDVLAAQTDRIMIRRDEALVATIDTLVARGRFKDTTPTDKLLGLHGTTAVRFSRENCPTCSMQITEHPEALECDIDLYNPTWGDVRAALGHTLEVLWPGKTDPFRIRRGLVKRGFDIPLVTLEDG